MSEPGGEPVTVARLIRPRGNKGELVALSLTAQPGRFSQLRRVSLRSPDGLRTEETEIESAWEHDGRLILKFRGIDTISSAELWRGADVQMPAEERAPAPPGEYYHSDLIGCRVVDRETGEDFGVVADCHEYGGPLLLAVRGAQGEFLLPFVSSFCVEIDVLGRRITVVLPEGLRDS